MPVQPDENGRPTLVGPCTSEEIAQVYPREVLQPMTDAIIDNMVEQSDAHAAALDRLHRITTTTTSGIGKPALTPVDATKPIPQGIRLCLDPSKLRGRAARKAARRHLVAARKRQARGL